MFFQLSTWCLQILGKTCLSDWLSTLVSRALSLENTFQAELTARMLSTQLPEQISDANFRLSFRWDRLTHALLQKSHFEGKNTNHQKFNNLVLLF